MGANNIVNMTQLNTVPATCGAHLQCVYCVAAAPPPPPKQGDIGVAVDGDHERVGAQDLEKENEDNNGGEKGDGQY